MCQRQNCLHCCQNVQTKKIKISLSHPFGQIPPRQSLEGGVWVPGRGSSPEWLFQRVYEKEGQGALDLYPKKIPKNSVFAPGQLLGLLLAIPQERGGGRVWLSSGGVWSSEVARAHRGTAPTWRPQPAACAPQASTLIGQARPEPLRNLRLLHQTGRAPGENHGCAGRCPGGRLCATAQEGSEDTMLRGAAQPHVALVSGGRRNPPPYVG